MIKVSYGPMRNTLCQRQRGLRDVQGCIESRAVFTPVNIQLGYQTKHTQKMEARKSKRKLVLGIERPVNRIDHLGRWKRR